MHIWNWDQEIWKKVKQEPYAYKETEYNLPPSAFGGVSNN